MGIMKGHEGSPGISFNLHATGYTFSSAVLRISADEAVVGRSALDIAHKLINGDPPSLCTHPETSSAVLVQR
jgi:ribosomal protein L13